MKVRITILITIAVMFMAGSSSSASTLTTIPDAGFESGLWTTPYYDTPSLPHDTGSITPDTTIHHSGTTSAKLVMRGNSGIGGNQLVALGLASGSFSLPVGTHTIAVWLYAPSHIAAPPALSFGAIYYDSSSNVISTDYVPYDFTNIPNNTWYQASGTLTVPAGTASVRAYFVGRNYSVDSGPLTCYFDDFTIDGSSLRSLPASN